MSIKRIQIITYENIFYEDENKSISGNTLLNFQKVGTFKLKIHICEQLLVRVLKDDSLLT